MHPAQLIVQYRSKKVSVPFQEYDRTTRTSYPALESVALKAITVLAILDFQKPSRSSKTKALIACLERRLTLWRYGNLNELVLEGRTIQQCLPKQHLPRAAQQLARSLFAGNSKAVLRLIAEQSKGRVLRLDDLIHTSNSPPLKVKDILESKHPPALYDSVIHSDPPPSVHPIVFDALDAPTIRTAALHTNGAAGPSGLDAHCWRRLCSFFGGASNELCHFLAKVAVWMRTSFVDPSSVSPLMSCHLIAIDKNPGVRPIGICQTGRRIIAKAELSIVGSDVMEAAGSFHLCAGQPSGTEAAVHAVQMTFQKAETEAVLLVDASNAFNALHRQAALHNIMRLCPSIATILINTYRNPSELFVDGSTIWSQEGNTQGDLLAIPMYALATIPLIQKLSTEVLQVWYADDATAAGKLPSLREWWNRLTTIGPAFGYFYYYSLPCCQGLMTPSVGQLSWLPRKVPQIG